MAKKNASDAQETAEEETAAAPTCVAMKRNPEQWPPEKHGPSTADVHPDEVENWKKHGWEHA